MSKSLTIRAKDQWFSKLQDLLILLDKKANRDRSGLVRELVSREYDYYFTTPYFSPKMRCLAFVASDGSAVYWQRQHLVLREDRAVLPCVVEVKPEKRADYVDPQLAQDNWLINYFAAWRGKEVRDTLIADGTDPHGSTSKHVDLKINLGQDNAIIKESLIANRRYVQWHNPADRRDDRADIFIDIPTDEIDIQIIVDLDLYQDKLRREDAKLDYQLRNRDLIRCNKLSLSQEPEFSWKTFRFPGSPELRRRDDYVDLHDTVTNSVRDLKKRLRDLCREEPLTRANDQLVVDTAEKRDFLRSVRIPDDFLFGRLTWRRPYQNLVLCMTWNRPAERGLGSFN